MLHELDVRDRKETIVNGRPKLLFLAYFFPPVQTSGSVRTWNIAKYLARSGWDVTVVTPHPSVWRYADNPERVSKDLSQEGIRRILTGHRWRYLEPSHLKCWNRGMGWVLGGACRRIARSLGLDRGAGWIREAERACAPLTPDKCDVILASGKPFASFTLAKRLSDRLGRPYVLDYRDPWTGDPRSDYTSRLAVIRKEASLLEGCAAITIVSPSWGVLLDRRFGVGSKLHVVTNGYDPGETAAIQPYDFGHCAFVYAGIFYPPKRVISPFLAALKRLRESLNENNNGWYFHYYGMQENHIREQADRCGLNDRIVLHGRVPRQEVLSALKGASLAVVITSVAEQDTLEDKGIVPAKIFEAIALGKPVLLITPTSSDVIAITTPTGLVKSFAGTDVQGMASFLKDVVCGRAPQPQDIEACSWTTIGKNFDALLRGVVARHRSHAHVGNGDGGKSE